MYEMVHGIEMMSLTWVRHETWKRLVSIWHGNDMRQSSIFWVRE